jgi:hypothetical protein
MTTLMTEASPPPLFVRTVMRPMTKVFNPLIVRLAGRRHVNFAAKIHHRGRRSGQVYVTPATARLSGGIFWIGLTFGSGSDWCRNVLAAGECVITWHGQDYRATRPSLVDRSVGLAGSGRAFKRRERAVMRVIGITQFLRLEMVPT